MKLKVGDKAPAFTLPDQDGAMHALKDYKGKWVLLYFYPKDDTPGCTTQACGIRDSYSAFEDRGAVVLGVSPDEETSHVKFKEKYGLPFTLLADPEHRVAEEYGVIACLAVVGLFAAVVLRAYLHSFARRDAFLRLAIAGLATLFGLQALINMAVNVGLVPAKGMTLPLVSAGGSSLLSVYLTVGMLLAATRRRPDPSRLRRPQLSATTGLGQLGRSAQ